MIRIRCRERSAKKIASPHQIEDCADQHVNGRPERAWKGYPDFFGEELAYVWGRKKAEGFGGAAFAHMAFAPGDKKKPNRERLGFS